FFADSALEIATTALLTYVKQHGKQLRVEAIDNLVLSCPFTLNKTALDGASIYTVGACFNVTGLVFTPPGGIAKQVNVGHAKVDVSVQLKRGTRTEVKVNMAVPVYKDVYVKVLGIPVPAGGLVAKIIGGLGKVLEGVLKGVVALLP
ncbi:hypothetical protein TSMEX_005092, partial [Taenia solium]